MTDRATHLSTSDAQIARSYDTSPYSSHAYAISHPDRLRTTASLFGVDAPEVGTCRILEVGCALGGNLIPMACELPGAECVGVETSPRQVAYARETIGALGLQNVRVELGSLVDIVASWGRFDYIIAHGVLSWVPPEVRIRLFEICSTNLSDTGLVYLSYNTLPGWSYRGIAREAMCWHTRGIESPKERVAQARAIVHALAAAQGQEDGVHARALRREQELVRAARDTEVIHDWLEPDNRPFWFHEIADKAQVVGLRYVGEADPFTMVPDGLWPEARRLLQQAAGDVIREQQLRDLLTGHSHRASIFCHDSREVSARMDLERVAGLLIRCPAVQRKPLPEGGGPLTFTVNDDIAIKSDDPLVCAALTALGQAWPRALPFHAVLERAVAGARATVPDLTAAAARGPLASELLGFFRRGAVGLHTWQPDLPTGVATRPRATDLARYQAQRVRLVTNRWHTHVELAPVVHRLLPLLDGTRDREALTDALVNLVDRGELKLPPPQPGAAPPALDDLRRMLGGVVDSAIRRLDRWALLAAGPA